MTTHGRNKVGPVKDDEVKKELEGELRSGRTTRAEEWHELQPSGEDQPDTDLAPDTTLTGGTPSGMSPEDVEIRTELARHLGRAAFPADREGLLAALRTHNAPDELSALVSRLPADGEHYENVQHVVRALGYGTEKHRM